MATKNYDFTVYSQDSEQCMKRLTHVFCLHTKLAAFLSHAWWSFWWYKTFRYGRQKLETFTMTNLGLLNDLLPWCSKIKSVHHL